MSTVHSPTAARTARTPAGPRRRPTPMASQPAATPASCRRCGPAARIQAVPAAYAAGVSTTQTSTSYTFNGGRYRGHSRSQSIRHTELADYLTPPAPLPAPRAATAAAIMFLGLAVVLLYQQIVYTTTGDQSWSLPPLCLIIGAVCALAASHRWRQIQREAPVVATAQTIWHQALYCATCGQVFLPGCRPVLVHEFASSLWRTAAERLNAATLGG